MEKNLTVRYHSFTQLDEMEKKDQELVRNAMDAAASSYAPYSGFNVGAAAFLSNGATVKGSNQENAAYPSGMCAERVAMFSAGVQYPEEAIVALAIVGMKDGIITELPTPPCGACRQVMAEYQKKGGRPMNIICYGRKSILKFDSVDSLLPFSFSL